MSEERQGPLDGHLEDERGTSYAFAVWGEKSAPPRIGEIVNVSDLVTPGGDIGERRATPLTPGQPGEGTTRRYVVVERHPRCPGLGRVLGETRLRDHAALQVRDLADAKLGNDKPKLRVGLSR
jgi:hypothetical protein